MYECMEVSVRMYGGECMEVSVRMYGGECMNVWRLV